VAIIASLAWAPVTGATGYLVFSSQTSGVYGTGTDVGNVIEATVELAVGGRWYFVIRAYDAGGVGAASAEAFADYFLEPTSIAAFAGPGIYCLRHR